VEWGDSIITGYWAGSTIYLHRQLDAQCLFNCHSGCDRWSQCCLNNKFADCDRFVQQLQLHRCISKLLSNDSPRRTRLCRQGVWHCDQRAKHTSPHVLYSSCVTIVNVVRSPHDLCTTQICNIFDLSHRSSGPFVHEVHRIVS
jgi:hypothetical protein